MRRLWARISGPSDKNRDKGSSPSAAPPSAPPAAVATAANTAAKSTAEAETAERERHADAADPPLPGAWDAPPPRPSPDPPVARSPDSPPADAPAPASAPAPARAPASMSFSTPSSSAALPPACAPASTPASTPTPTPVSAPAANSRPERKRSVSAPRSAPRAKQARETNTVPFLASPSAHRSPPLSPRSSQPSSLARPVLPPTAPPARRRLSTPNHAQTPPHGQQSPPTSLGALPSARRSASSLVGSLAPSTHSLATVGSSSPFGLFPDSRAPSMGATWANITNAELVMNIGTRERTRQEVLWEIVASEQRHVDELLRTQDLYVLFLLHPHRFTTLQQTSTPSEAVSTPSLSTSVPASGKKRLLGRRSGGSTTGSDQAETKKSRSSQARAPKDPFELGIAVPIPPAVRSVLEAISGPDGLVAVHTSLANALRTRYEAQYPLVRSLADVFAAHARPLLDAYTAYAVSLGVALTQLDEARLMARALRGKTLRKEAQALADTVLFGRAVAKLEAAASVPPRTASNAGVANGPGPTSAPSLPVALARPLQRLLKYPLLAQNLLFHTDPSTAEFEATVDMVAGIEVLVRQVQAQKVSADALDATLDAMARIEAITDRRLLKPSDTRTLVSETPVYPSPAPTRSESAGSAPGGAGSGAGAARPDSSSSSSNPPPTAAGSLQTQLRSTIKTKRSFRRLSDLLDHPSPAARVREDSLPAPSAQQSQSSGSVLSALSQGLLGAFLTPDSGGKTPTLGSKRDLWSVKFSDVELRCQRIGVTTLPMASSVALRPPGSEAAGDESLTRRAKESKDRLKALRTETLRTPSRNLYKFIGVVAWHKTAAPAPQPQMEDEAATRAALLAGAAWPWDLHGALEEEEEWDESVDGDSGSELDEPESDADADLDLDLGPILPRGLETHALLRPESEEDESEVLATSDPADALTWPAIRDIDEEMTTRPTTTHNPAHTHQARASVSTTATGSSTRSAHSLKEEDVAMCLQLKARNKFAHRVRERPEPASASVQASRG